MIVTQKLQSLIFPPFDSLKYSAIISIASIAGLYLCLDSHSNNLITYFLAIICLFPRTLNLIISNYRSSELLKLSALLILYLFISTMFISPAGIRKVFSAGANSLLLLIFLGAIISSDHNYPQFRKWLIISLIISASIAALYGIFEYIKGRQAGLFPSTAGSFNFLNKCLGTPDELKEWGQANCDLAQWRVHLFGRLKNPVIGGVSLGFAAALAFSHMIYELRWRHFILWLAGLTCILLGVYFTTSRGAAAGLISAGTMAIICRLNAPPFLIYLLFTGLCGACGWLVIGPSWIEYIPRGIGDRNAIWDSYLHAIFQRPFFGAGITDSTILQNQTGTIAQHAHNIYLSTTYYGGLVALALLSYLQIRAIKIATKLSSSTFGACALSAMMYSCTVLLVDGGLFITKITWLWLVFWLPILFCGFIENKLSREQTVI